MTESELLAELEMLTQVVPAPGGDGFSTTAEMVAALMEKGGVTERAANTKVLDMLHAAEDQGRLVIGRAYKTTLGVRRSVPAYKLKDA